MKTKFSAFFQNYNHKPQIQMRSMAFENERRSSRVTTGKAGGSEELGGGSWRNTGGKLSSICAFLAVLNILPQHDPPFF